MLAAGRPRRPVWRRLCGTRLVEHIGAIDAGARALHEHVRLANVRLRVALSATLALVMACGGGRGAAADSASAAADAARDIRIALERGACFGRCPMYRVELDGSGKVTFDGRNFVRDSGQRVDTIPADSVRALAREIEQAGYFAFEDRYPPDATDHATVTTTLTFDGRTKTIVHNLGSRRAPAELEKLYERIDEVARTAKWIGEPQTGPPLKGGIPTPVPPEPLPR